MGKIQSPRKWLVLGKLDSCMKKKNNWYYFLYTVHKSNSKGIDDLLNVRSEGIKSRGESIVGTHNISLSNIWGYVSPQARATINGTKSF